MGKRHRRIRARSATRQVAGAANEKLGLNTPIAQNGLPSLRSPEGPCPSRPNLSRRPDDMDAFKEAVSCREQPQKETHNADANRQRADHFRRSG